MYGTSFKFKSQNVRKVKESIEAQKKGSKESREHKTERINT